MTKFAWWPHTTNPAVASYRLRCKRIVEWLQNKGFEAGIYDAGIKPEILVLSKRYDRQSIETAQQLRSKYDTRLILDLCDNHFYAETTADVWKNRAQELREAITAVDLVIASTSQLANVIKEETACNNVEIIGDAVELPYYPNVLLRAFHLKAELELMRLRNKMVQDGISSGHRLVWYGNHGSGNAEGGMSDLNRLKDILEYCHRNYSISLTVISNNEAKYKKITASWALPTYYLDWDLTTVSTALQLHDIAVIPVTKNAFTMCKTNNRIATAFLHGLAIVADSIPSYQSFSDCIVLDNWEAGITKLITDKQYKESSVNTGINKIKTDWSIHQIAGLWLAALNLEKNR